MRGVLGAALEAHELSVQSITATAGMRTAHSIGTYVMRTWRLTAGWAAALLFFLDFVMGTGHSKHVSEIPRVYTVAIYN